MKTRKTTLDLEQELFDWMLKRKRERGISMSHTMNAALRLLREKEARRK